VIRRTFENLPDTSDPIAANLSAVKPEAQVTCLVINRLAQPGIPKAVRTG
jgi:hypothetical protein